MIKPSNDYEVLSNDYEPGECCSQVVQFTVNGNAYDINKEIETNRIIMYSSSASDMIVFNDLDITLRKALEYIPNVNPDKFVVDWIDNTHNIDNILDTRICDMKLMQGTIRD
jgi:hypothetical protein